MGNASLDLTLYALLEIEEEPEYHPVVTFHRTIYVRVTQESSVEELIEEFVSENWQWHFTYPEQLTLAERADVELTLSAQKSIEELQGIIN